jgi:hypothetical protein
LPLAQQQRAALLLGDDAQRGLEAEELVGVALVCGYPLLDQLHVARRLDESPPVGVPLLGQADVVRDLEEPRRLELGRGPALEPAERVQERRLRRILGLLTVAELMHAEREDLPLMALVEQAGGFTLRREPGRSRNRRRTAFGRNCGHLSP